MSFLRGVSATLRRFGAPIGYVLFVLAAVAAFLIYRADLREQDVANCKSQRDGREAVAGLFKDLLPPPKPDDDPELVEFRRRLDALEEPIPCEIELGLVPSAD